MRITQTIRAARQVLAARWHAPQGYREVLRVGLPLIASMASTTVMQFTDRLFLSHYSVTSIAAALPAGIMALTLQLAFVGICSYVSVFIAQYVGAGANSRVGAALWQGIWVAILSGLVLLLPCLAADSIFAWAGHAPAVQAQEVTYFNILMAGSVFFLLGSVVSGFFVGRGYTRPVFIANLAGAVLNVPLDYLFIFGGFGFPEMGIAGAALATALGWVLCFLILAFLVFTKKNDARYGVLRSWRPEKELSVRLLRYGVPSGANFFMEIVGFTWFTMEVGRLGEISLAASTIAFSINSLVFMPMLGLNSAVASLVGQAMGRKKPLEAETVTQSALHLSLAYMMPLAVIFVVFAGPLMDLFRPAADMAAFAPVRATGIVLLYYVALYSLVDSCNIIYLGALKGAGDTMFVMIILGSAAVFGLILPILTLQYFALDILHTLWGVLTAYVFILAFFARRRFLRQSWHTIRMIEV